MSQCPGLFLFPSNWFTEFLIFAPSWQWMSGSHIIFTQISCSDNFLPWSLITSVIYCLASRNSPSAKVSMRHSFSDCERSILISQVKTGLLAICSFYLLQLGLCQGTLGSATNLSHQLLPKCRHQCECRHGLLSSIHSTLNWPRSHKGPIGHSDVIFTLKNSLGWRDKIHML